MALASTRGLDVFVRGRMYQPITGKVATNGLSTFIRGSAYSAILIPSSVFTRRFGSRTNLVARRSATVSIPASSTTSTAFDGQGYLAFGLITPANLTGTTFTFEVSHDDVTYQQLCTASGAVSVKVAASKATMLPEELAPWRYFKLVSDATETSERLLEIGASSR